MQFLAPEVALVDLDQRPIPSMLRILSQSLVKVRRAALVVVVIVVRRSCSSEHWRLNDETLKERSMRRSPRKRLGRANARLWIVRIVGVDALRQARKAAAPAHSPSAMRSPASVSQAWSAVLSDSSLPAARPPIRIGGRRMRASTPSRWQAASRPSSSEAPIWMRSLSARQIQGGST